MMFKIVITLKRVPGHTTICLGVMYKCIGSQDVNMYVNWYTKEHQLSDAHWSAVSQKPFR